MAEIVAETMVRRWALALFGLIPGAELRLFDECGRQVQWDQAARFNEVVSAFLKAVT